MVALNVNRKQLQTAFDEIAKSGFLTEGKYVRLLEEEVGKWSGLHAVAVNSAGTGLYTMLRCLQGVRGDAIVSNNTFFATGAMAVEAGYQVKLADCSEEDFCLSLDTVKAQVNKVKTRLVILTHVGGGLAKEYEAIANFCKEKKIPLIEDAAHALAVGGDNGPGPTAGTLGLGAVFSVYPTKAVPAGDGGIIVTSDEVYAEELRRFRNYGKYVEGGKLSYTGYGFNFRMDEWTAAVTYLQLCRRQEIVERREAAADKLRKVVKPIVDWGEGQSNWYKFIAPAEFEATRQTGKVYAASDQLTSSLGAKSRRLPASEWVAANHICLPIEEGLYDGMKSPQIEAYLKGKS